MLGTKEEVLEHYHKDKEKWEAASEDAFFLTSLLGSIGDASDMGDPFIETCKGLGRIMSGICAEFLNSLNYLEHFAGLVEKDSQEEEGMEVSS